MALRKNLNPNALTIPARVLGSAGLAVLTVLFLLLMAGRASAATQVWDGGCGADHSWSCASNWKSNAVPAPGDTVAFNAKSIGASIVDPSFGGEVAVVRLAAGYTGRVALARSLTVSKGIQQFAGEFAASEHILSTKDLTLKGGTFEASSNRTSISGTMSVTGSPEFDSNDGTLVVEGTGGKLICGGIVLSRVVFDNPAGTKTVTPSCDLPLGDNPDAGAGGSIKLEGTLSGSGSLSTTGLLTLGSTGSLSGFSRLDANNLTVNGDYDFGGYSSISVSEVFNLNAGGDFTAPTGVASFAGRFKIVPVSAFDPNGGTVVFDGTANSSISCGNKSFALVRFEQTSGVKVVENDCSLPLGAGPTLGGGTNVRLNGTLSGSGTLAVGQSLTLSRTAQLSGFGGLEVGGDLTMANATEDFHAYAPLSVGGNYSQAAGKISAPGGADFAGSLTLYQRAVFEAPAGSVAIAGGFWAGPEAAFRANGGTVVFDGSQSAVLNCGGTKFNAVSFAHIAGTKTVGSTCSLPLGSSPAAGTGSIILEGTLSGSGVLATGGTLSLAATGALSGFSGLAAQGLDVEGAYDFGAYSSFSVGGTFAIGAGGSFRAPSGTASFAGDFLNEGGTFLANGGSVVLDGSNQRIGGSTTFDNLTKVAGSTDTLTFGSGETQTVQGTLRLKGSDWAHLMTLASSSSGAPWRLDRGGSAEVEFVSVADSTNVGTPITAPESKSNGGNSGWSISGPAVQLALEAQSANQSAGASNNLTIVAKDAYGNASASYTGSHSLTFGPVADSPSGAHATVADSSGTAVNFGTATPISFNEGVATVSGAKNGAMTLVKAGSTSITVTDGSVSNGSGLAATVSPGAAARIAWTHATMSKGTLSSPCLFTCTGIEMSSMGNFKANVSITDGSGNTVSGLGSGKTASVTSASGTITGGTLTIAASGQAESTTQFTYTSSKGGAVTLTAATASGTVYTSATASMMR
jgi:hypothetical protein